ncbi:hypothetical protein [Confluentibacter citreus]|nr:hypothetical protein [Confluentibacter citreus]
MKTLNAITLKIQLILNAILCKNVMYNFYPEHYSIPSLLYP